MLFAHLALRLEPFILSFLLEGSYGMNKETLFLIESDRVFLCLDQEDTHATFKIE